MQRGKYGPDRDVFYVAHPVRSIVKFKPLTSRVPLNSRLTTLNCSAAGEIKCLDLSPFCPFEPLQRSWLKIQFAFCLGIRYASHLSPVVNRIRTTIPFQSILN